jgi:two-component system, OmpR family, sensor histidine kinase CreC
MINIGLGFRFYIVYFLLIGAIAWIIVQKSLESVDQSVRQAAEEIMVDSANMLAASSSGKETLDVATMSAVMEHYLQREINARIYERFKQHGDMQIYVTDRHGTVLYDSTGKSTGKDFSDWKDVSATLAGQYGARSSAYDPDNLQPLAAEKALYVAAPIYDHQQQRIGVLTIFKSIKNLGNFVIQQREQIIRYAIIVFIASLVFGAAITWFLSRSIRKLVVYANTLAQGKKVSQPVINQLELKTLSNAIKHLRQQLDGKQYVENYIHTMAHELKTPITGIQSAAELLLEPMPEEKRRHFLQHILDSSSRLTLLIEKLLALSLVEKKDELEHTTKIDVHQAISAVLHSRDVLLTQRDMYIDYTPPPPLSIEGDAMLVEQAIANILDNAIDFSQAQGRIQIQVNSTDNRIIIQIIDEGSGIPEYALPRLYERFFSLSRPESGKRGTGLGLRFVREVMELHGGSVLVANRDTGGVLAELTFQRQLHHHT